MLTQLCQTYYYGRCKQSPYLKHILQCGSCKKIIIEIKNYYVYHNFSANIWHFKCPLYLACEVYIWRSAWATHQSLSYWFKSISWHCTTRVESIKINVRSREHSAKTSFIPAKTWNPFSLALKPSTLQSHDVERLWTEQLVQVPLLRLPVIFKRSSL